MLLIQPSGYHLRTLLENTEKQNNCFVVGEAETKKVEQLIDEIVFTTFGKAESFLVILLRKFVLELVSRKLSVPLLEEIFQLVKQYESESKLYKKHFFHLEKLLFGDDNGREENQIENQALDLESAIQNQLNSSLLLKAVELSPNNQEKSSSSPSAQRNSKSLCIDIDCYSQDSKNNFNSRCDDKYFCSQYLTTSEDEKDFTSRSIIIKQLKEKIQNKLKIEPRVSGFTFGVQTKNVTFDIDQQILDWKRTKHSILKEMSLQKALSPQDLDENKFVQKMKQNHYRQKIKSAIVKRRLSSKHLTN